LRERQPKPPFAIHRKIVQYASSLVMHFALRLAYSIWGHQPSFQRTRAVFAVEAFAARRRMISTANRVSINPLDFFLPPEMAIVSRPNVFRPLGFIT